MPVTGAQPNPNAAPAASMANPSTGAPPPGQQMQDTVSRDPRANTPGYDQFGNPAGSGSVTPNNNPSGPGNYGTAPGYSVAQDTSKNQIGDASMTGGGAPPPAPAPQVQKAAPPQPIGTYAQTSLDSTSSRAPKPTSQMGSYGTPRSTLNPAYRPVTTGGQPGQNTANAQANMQTGTAQPGQNTGQQTSAAPKPAPTAPKPMQVKTQNNTWGY